MDEGDQFPDITRSVNDARRWKKHASKRISSGPMIVSSRSASLEEKSSHDQGGRTPSPGYDVPKQDYDGQVRVSEMDPDETLRNVVSALEAVGPDATPTPEQCAILTRGCVAKKRTEAGTNRATYVAAAIMLLVAGFLIGRHTAARKGSSPGPGNAPDVDNGAGTGVKL